MIKTTKTVDALETLDRDTLIQLWQAHFKSVPPKGLSVGLLKRFLSFEFQSHKGAVLNAADKRKIRQYHNSTHIHRKPTPQLKPGSQLIREWNGKTNKIEVTKNGFVWEGKSYRSLTAIARAITGTHWSGPRFFGLNKHSDAKQ